jgi:hypothetical protein
MKVTNNTSFPVIAFGYEIERGYGEDVMIPAGETKEVSGPYIGDMGGGRCYVAIPDELVCQEEPDNDVGLQIGKGVPIYLLDGNLGITIRHKEDPEEEHTRLARDSI